MIHKTVIRKTTIAGEWIIIVASIESHIFAQREEKKNSPTPIAEDFNGGWLCAGASNSRSMM
jgi:hypothetical protein